MWSREGEVRKRRWRELPACAFAGGCQSVRLAVFLIGCERTEGTEEMLRSRMLQACRAMCKSRPIVASGVSGMPAVPRMCAARGFVGIVRRDFSSVKVFFDLPSGERKECAAEEGTTVLQVAHDNGVDLEGAVAVQEGHDTV